MSANATKTPELKPMTPETREHLLKYFGAKPPEKPLAAKEFDSIKDYVDRRRGGLAKEAYAMVKEDTELVKAAAISQARKNQRTMERRTPEIRETLLKALRSHPGEKNLTLSEFKEVAVFLDFKNGGIRHHAFRLFKDDKEVLQAAEKNRFMKQEVDAAPDQSKAIGKNAAREAPERAPESAIDSVRSRRGCETDQTHEAERGE